jgi:hypothetical protein
MNSTTYNLAYPNTFKLSENNSIVANVSNPRLVQLNNVAIQNRQKVRNNMIKEKIIQINKVKEFKKYYIKKIYVNNSKTNNYLLTNTGKVIVTPYFLTSQLIADDKVELEQVLIDSDTMLFMPFRIYKLYYKQFMDLVARNESIFKYDVFVLLSLTTNRRILRNYAFRNFRFRRFRRFGRFRKSRKNTKFALSNRNKNRSNNNNNRRGRSRMALKPGNMNQNNVDVNNVPRVKF